MILLLALIILGACFIFLIYYAENYSYEQSKKNKVNKKYDGIQYRPLINGQPVQPLKPAQPSQPIVEEKPQYETTTFNIAGVTFTDGRCKRQTALRMLKFKDAPMDGSILFEFEQYDYEGQQAVKIIANDRILGNVPADKVDDFIEKMETHSDYDIDYVVKGGGDYPFGCTMTFTWK